MRFALEIKCDNAAFDPDEDLVSGAEVARILRDVALRVECADRLDEDSEGTMRDANGNTVGTWSLEQ